MILCGASIMKNSNIFLLSTLFIIILNVTYAIASDNSRLVPALKNPYPAIFTSIEQRSRDILWSQIPNPANAVGVSCQLDSVYPFESDVADDIDPDGTGWAIDSVRTWWSNWGGFYGWYNVPNIHFLVYADSGTTPPQPVDSPFVELVVESTYYTATSIGTDQWIVDMELPSAVELAFGEKYWIEVQPSNVFTMNGQTGWMSEVGIGNGQDLYQRFPEAGIDIWTSATAIQGLPYEAGFELIGSPLPTLITWDFETGQQGWLHTNGTLWPAAWTIFDSQYKSSAGYVCPAPGDSSMWIDSDAASGIWVHDTALSPILIPLSNTDWLFYGLCFNSIDGGDWYEVGLKYYDGSSWESAPLQVYTTDVSSQLDSVDISAYKTYELIQIYLYYDDNNTTAWYAAFDNVTIHAVISQDVHDVGVNAVHIPPYVPPGNITEVSAQYCNFGDFNESFLVGITIDSSGINIYNETTNVILDAATDTVITFIPWTACLTPGVIYDGYAFAYLVADINPTNDTMEFQTIIASHFWEVLDSLPVISSGHYGATLHDSSYMVFGIHQTGQYLNDTYIYNIIDDTWTQGPDNPYGCGAHGMAFGVNGTYYRFGGSDYMIMPNNRVDIYNPSTGIWSSGAALPDSNMDMAGGVYQDSLVYMFGGGNWVGFTPVRNDVYFYDVYLDTWTEATPFPGVARGCCGAGVIDTFAIVVGGYDGTFDYLDDYVVGVIDSDDPSSIAWGSVTTIPGGFEGRCRFCYAVDPLIDKELWVAAGRGTTNPQCPDIWSYNPYTDTWTNWNTPMNCPIAFVSSVPMTYTTFGDIGFFVAGGYTGPYINYHEVFHTSVFGIEETPLPQNVASTFGFTTRMQNPTNKYSGFTYTTTKPGKVLIRIYDNAGRAVKTLADRMHEPAGTKTVYWNAQDNAQRIVANGVYFVRLEAEEEATTLKIILIK
jgi:hypothetical protein